MSLSREIVCRVNINFDKTVCGHHLGFERSKFCRVGIGIFLVREVCILLGFIGCLWLFTCSHIFSDLGGIIMLKKHLQWGNYLDSNYRNNTSKIDRYKHECLFPASEYQLSMKNDYKDFNFLFMLINRCAKHKKDMATNYSPT